MDLETCKQLLVGVELRNKNVNQYYKIWLEQRANGEVDVAQFISKTNSTSNKALISLFNEWEQGLEDALLNSKIAAFNLFHANGLPIMVDPPSLEEIPEHIKYHYIRLGDEQYLQVKEDFREILTKLPPVYSFDEPSVVLRGQTLLYQQHIIFTSSLLIPYFNEATMHAMGNFGFDTMNIPFSNIDLLYENNDELIEMLQVEKDKFYASRGRMVKLSESCRIAAQDFLGKFELKSFDYS